MGTHSTIVVLLAEYGILINSLARRLKYLVYISIKKRIKCKFIVIGLKEAVLLLHLMVALGESVVKILPNVLSTNKLELSDI